MKWQCCTALSNRFYSAARNTISAETHSKLRVCFHYIYSISWALLNGGWDIKRLSMGKSLGHRARIFMNIVNLQRMNCFVCGLCITGRLLGSFRQDLPRWLYPGSMTVWVMGFLRHAKSWCGFSWLSSGIQSVPCCLVSMCIKQRAVAWNHFRNSLIFVFVTMVLYPDSHDVDTLHTSRQDVLWWLNCISHFTLPGILDRSQIL